MEKKNIKFITIEQDIHIGGSSTSEIVDRFKRLILADIIDVSKAIFCRIKYDIMGNKVEDGPVNIYFSNGIRVKLNLTAGYTGEGPRDTCEVLKLCGFDFNQDDIFTHNDVIDIKYYKDIDNENIYQFKNLDGSFEYSSL